MAGKQAQTNLIKKEFISSPKQESRSICFRYSLIQEFQTVSSVSVSQFLNPPLLHVDWILMS